MTPSACQLVTPNPQSLIPSPQHIPIHPLQQRLIMCPADNRRPHDRRGVRAAGEAQHLDRAAAGLQRCIELLGLLGRAAVVGLALDK